MILKDYKRAERLNEVYKHLFANFGIKSKKEMADYMKIQRTGLSAALNGAAPFKRNRSTDYSGPLFGTSGETSVMLNNEWSEPFVGEW